MMLSPLSLHASLEALTAPLPSSTSQTAMRADLAALVLTDDGSLYASSSSSASTSAAPAQTLKQQQQQQQPAASGPLSGLEQQYVRKPGLRGLLGFGKPGLRAPAPVPVTAPASTKAGDEGPRAMDLDLRPDERVRVLCALARQAWLEEVARVHRLRSENENGDDIVGDDDDEEEEQERVDLDVAVPGTMLANGVAPLMVESELGPLVVVPLHGQANDRPPLLLVLAKDVAALGVAEREAGFSALSQEQWSSLHEAGAAYRTFVGPHLKRAFGTPSSLADADADADDAGAGTDAERTDVDESGDEQAV